MRADVYVVSRGAVASRTLAQKLILQGAVSVDGRVIAKPAEEIADGAHELTVRESDDLRYVGRGGLKLEAALAAFPVTVAECVLVDVGASTGGFTDCLLQNRAARVYAVDAGHGQLHPHLRADARVRVAEGQNARFLTPAHLLEWERKQTGTALRPDGSPFDGRVDGGVMDVSFISQTCILPALGELIRVGGFLISLIKPQFELRASALDKHGVVRREEDRRQAVIRVVESAQACGFVSRGIIPSPITGGDGNQEFIGYFEHL